MARVMNISCYSSKEDMVSRTDVPTREQLVGRASDLVPTLAKHANWAEQNRRLHDESIEALADAGIFKLRRRSGTAATRPTPAPWSRSPPNWPARTAPSRGPRRCTGFPPG